MKSILAVLVIAVILSGNITAAEPQVTVLDNGLTVVTLELHYAPVVASVISYRVGGRNEPDDILGMSHFCEHLMFKGTPDMPKSRFWQIVQRDGGMANAFTSEDCTCYYLMLPSSRIEDALSIESDRMVNCTMDSAEVVSERNVVHEERRMRSIDSPDGAMWEALMETAYTTHPYGNPVIGYDDNILGYDHVKASDYYCCFYRPSNAVLALVGDFETDEILTHVEEYFGDIPGGDPPVEDIPSEPVQQASRRVEVEHASNLPRFTMAFHSTSGSDPDDPAMNIIASYLYGGRSGRLEQLLVENGLVHSARAWNDGGIDPGLFYINIVMNPPETDTVTIEHVREIVWNELEDIAENGIPAEELEQQKNRYRASEILDDASPVGLALNYSLSATMFGDPLHHEKKLEEIEQLTPSDISGAASRIFRREGETLAVLNPTGEGGAHHQAERQELPTDITEPSSIDYEGLEIPDEFLTPPDISISSGVEQTELSNGLKLLVKQDSTFPIAAISFSVPIGGFRHSHMYNGLASATVETMLRGTDSLEYTEFHRRLEREGSFLRFYAGSEHSAGSVILLSEDLETAIQTLSDLLMRPAFRESDFSRVMEEQYANLQSTAERSFSVAYDSLMAITAATESDYRRPSENTLDRIGLERVKEFYRLCCRPSGSVITVVGDVDPEVVTSLTEDYFGEWQNPEEPLPEAVIPEFTTAPGDTVFTYMPGRMQAAVAIARRAPGNMMPEYPAFSIMNRILGRGIGSRLEHSVRDEQGLAYGVGSWSTAYDSTGVFTAYLSTLSDYVPQATGSVISEIRKITNENVREIELRLAKSNSVGSQAFTAMTYASLSSRL
ncbi:MAG: hypothetical protein GF388_12250, partial [Candidatus Aegiribacteria sp.]|nr:hypothetical protein [Candidatus Aegiribacteria sp.]MBD3295721.1 hypothetical protein [Candidatus Fermentibacteria bacterium]